MQRCAARCELMPLWIKSRPPLLSVRLPTAELVDVNEDSVVSISRSINYLIYQRQEMSFVPVEYEVELLTARILQISGLDVIRFSFCSVPKR